MSKNLLVALFTSLAVTVLWYFVLYNVFLDDLRYVQSFVSDTLSEQDNKLSRTLDNNLSLVQAQIVDTVSRVSPWVVSIVATKNIQLYFADPRGVLPGVLTESEATVWWWSGIYSSQSGYIITNKHVVNDVNASYTIIDHKWNTYEVVNIWFDDVLDFAVLKIDSSDTITLPVTSYVDFATDIHVGSFVLAIWNSLSALQNSVTFGIISATNRNLITTDSDILYAGLLQTDTAINPWNSGGPLVNVYGEVIGIMTAIINQGQGIGFALPVSQEFIDATLFSVEEYGQIVRPYLGISYIDIDRNVVEQLGIQKGINHGIYIENIIDWSPAEQAGLRAWDIVLSLNKKNIDIDNSFLYQLYTFMPGDTIDVEIVRNWDPLTLSLVLWSWIQD